MDWLDVALSKFLDKTRQNIVNIGSCFPHASLNGRYSHEKPEFWTSGFWPGILWLYYSQTQDEKAKVLAIELEEKLDTTLDEFEALYHDVGFMWQPSAVMHYKYDQNHKSKIRALKAASHLAGRFNPEGEFIRAWTEEVMQNSQGIAIIDCMMNLSLLYWATAQTNDPRFKNVAMKHADTVMRHFIRDDFSSPHIVRFNPYSGEKIENLPGQGKSALSSWSRGQAWALYGFAVSYRETAKLQYMNMAESIAENILAKLSDDKIPPWDYSADEHERYGKDSSAAAITASGLLQLSQLTADGVKKQYYYKEALSILKAIYNDYTDFSNKEEGIVLKGTVSFPDNRYINTPIIYGDFFFLEAVLRAKKGLHVF